MKKIMLIDDDEAAHIYHKAMIEMAGLDREIVVSFYEVEEALTYLSQVSQSHDTSQWPTYIFVDLNMPIKSGYDFIRGFQELNADLRLPHIYFVSSTKNPLDIQKVNEIDIIKGFETKFLEKDFFAALGLN